jgi:hypothetical protein
LVVPTNVNGFKVGAYVGADRHHPAVGLLSYDIVPIPPRKIETPLTLPVRGEPLVVSQSHGLLTHE